MTSIRVKLTLVIVVISLLAVVLVGASARYITSSQFDRLRIDQAEANFIEAVSTYYAARGSWAGVQSYLVAATRPNAAERGSSSADPAPQHLGPVAALAPMAPSRPGTAGRDPLAVGGNRTTWRSPFALADRDGLVVVAAGPYRTGDALPLRVLRQAEAVQVNGEVVGVVSYSAEPELRALERAYLRRTGTTLLYATLLAGSMALVTGMIASGMFLRPIRDITGAIRNMRAGALAQTVPVRSRDEFGEMARAFNEMSAEVARGSRVREQMTADVAHELRTPLSVITGYLEGIRDGVLGATPDTVSTMYDEAVHLQRLVEDLQLLSLADAGRLTVQAEPITLADLFQSTASAFAAMAAQRSIQLEVDARAAPAPLDVDPNRMHQVLNNLVANALRYTPPGGTVRLDARQDAAGTVVRVSDTGCGIDPEALPHVFERFYRADPSRKHGEGAAGLGLAIARSLVAAHGGTIRASSTRGSGTTMTIRLPQGGVRA